MVHCPACETTIESAADVEFVDAGTERGFFEAPKRMYTANCAACGTVIAHGVAAKSASGGAAAGGAT